MDAQQIYPRFSSWHQVNATNAYDYVLGTLLSGELSKKIRDVIVSILQVDMGNELNRNMAAAIMAGVDEAGLMDAMEHLTAEERQQILDVMRRAQHVEEEATQRSREIEREYQEYNHKVLTKQASLDKTRPLCPVCGEWEFKDFTHDYTVNNDRNVCNDCERIVCPNCGMFEFNAKTKFQVWVCTVCSKRRRFLLSAGVQGVHQTGKLCLPTFDHDSGQRNKEYHCDAYGECCDDYYSDDYAVHVDTPRYGQYCKPALKHSWQRSHSLGQYEDSGSPQQKPLNRGDSLPTNMDENDNHPSFLDIPDNEYFAQNSTMRQHGKQRRRSDSEIIQNEPFCEPVRRVSHPVSLRQSDNWSTDRGGHLFKSLCVPEESVRCSQSSTNRSPTDFLRGDSHSPHRQLTEDYYMSEEEELALIAHQCSKHEWQHFGREDNHEGEYMTHEMNERDQQNYQQPARQHEWSPVMDLSPIEDVSPTLELEAEAEWLAEQEEFDQNVESERQVMLPKHQRVHNLHEQVSEELIDKGDSQSTTESGYESQSQGNLTTSNSEKITHLPVASRVAGLISAYENSSFDEKPESLSSHSIVRGQFLSSGKSQSVEDPFQEEQSETDLMMKYKSGLDFDDEVPIIEENVTFNIHGGRDMFAVRRNSPAKILKNSPQRKSSLDRLTNLDNRPGELTMYERHHSGDSKEETVSLIDNAEIDTPMDDEKVSPAGSSDSGKAQRPKSISITTQPLSQPLVNRPSPQPRSRLKLPDDSIMSSKSKMKPVPAPRRKADNSVRGKSSSNNTLESDDEIVEIRFDEESSPIIARHEVNNAATHAYMRLDHSTLKGLPNKCAAEEEVKKSMDELRKREHDESQKTQDLEKQLAEIRRLEERQRHILQNTLKQVVHSVHESQKLKPHQADECISTERIDCSSLLSPSFNRKTPLSSPSLSHRQTASPQSPRKSSLRQDMQTINENSACSISNLAAMSPASSHRALSNALPLLPQRLHEMRSSSYSGGSQSLPVRSDRFMQQAYQDIILQSGSLGDPYSEKNFRLSSSYTELLPMKEPQRDNSGYFSDREMDRRKGCSEMKAYTEEARRALVQWEIEKRQRQVEENKELRNELHRLIQSGSIPAAQYERLRALYREHMNRSKEFLRLSNSSLSSIGTTIGRGWDEKSFTTDSDFYMSSNEQLAAPLSQSSTVEQLMQSNDNLFTHKNLPMPSFAQASSTSACKAAVEGVSSAEIKRADSKKSKDEHDLKSLHETSIRPVTPAMPLLEIKSPKRSRPNSTEFAHGGDMYRASSEASFGDPEEKIVDAKLEGAGVTILKSKDRSPKPAMPISQFNFPTKQILITPGQSSRGGGMGLTIEGGCSIPASGVTGAFVSNIQTGTVAAQLLGELKIGDEIVEWNGVSLRNKANNIVQEIISKRSNEIELVVKLDKDPFPLPRHHSGSREEHHERVSGFESPQSDKSWSKEFDGKGAKKVVTPVNLSPEKHLALQRGNEQRGHQSSDVTTGLNNDYNHMELRQRKSEREAVDVEDHAEELNRKLQDMSERLDNLDKEPLSPNQIERRYTENSNRKVTRRDGNSNPDHSQENGYYASKRVGKVGGSVLPQTRRDPSTERGTPKGLESPMPTRGAVSTRDISPHVTHHRNQSACIAARHQNKLYHCGEIEVMLMYDYGRRLLIVRVERAVQLAIAGKDSVNPFIKIHFIKGERIQEKRCTRYIERNPNPRWEQSFSFSVEDSDLPEYKIKLSAWDYFQPKQNMFVGSALIDLANQSHVDGNLRLYKLDSDPAEKKTDSRNATPRMPRAAQITGESAQQRRIRPAEGRATDQCSDARKRTNPQKEQRDCRESADNLRKQSNVSAEQNNNTVKYRDKREKLCFPVQLICCTKTQEDQA